MRTKTLAILSLWRDSESYLKHSLAQFEAMEEVLFEKNISPVYCDTHHIGQTQGVEQRPEWSMDRLIQGPFIVNCSMFHKKAFDDCEGYDDSLKGWEDYDLWIRLRKENKQFFNCKAILVKHRIHSASAFNAKGNNNKVEDLLKSHNIVREGNKTIDEIKFSHLTKKI